MNINAEVERAFPLPSTASEMLRCLHPESEIRIRRYSGSWAYWKQCTTCGAAVGSAIPRKAVTSVAIKEWDNALDPDRPYADQRAAREAWQKRRDEHWWLLYSEYLGSDDWRSRRARVLKRDGGLCQGCLDAQATDVHHLSYEHVGEELLYELISLCNDCHMNRAHGGRKREDAA